MGTEIGESSGAGRPDNSREDAGNGSSVRRRFPLAAQPEVMRAAQKDEQYAAYVYEACRDAFRHLFGTRAAIYYQSEVAGSYGLPPTPARRTLFIVYQSAVPYIAERVRSRAAIYYQSETKLLGQMLYYILTTGAGQQTLGEEYSDITQVAGSYGLLPTPARRTSGEPYL